MPPTTTHRPGRTTALTVLFLALALVAAACSSDPTEDLATFTTNGGAITVGAPDDGSSGGDGVDAADRPEDPEAVSFLWFDGTPGSSSDFAGKPTVLNFWASNCAACIAEMPEFEEAWQAVGDRVAFVGANNADPSRQSAEELVAQTGVTYPLLDDPNSELFRKFNGFVMPTTVFLDENGEAVFTWSGVLNLEELRILIDEHIAPGTL